MTLEGTYVRVAYNNEGYAIIGYRLANMSVGEEWMLLEFGTTVRDGVPDYKLTRNALSIETPDGKTIPMATNEEYRGANLTALQMREKVQRDSINYFPPSANRSCRIGYFAEVDQRGMAYDEVELSSQRACLGRLYLQGARRDRVRAALAQREVPEQPHPRTVQNPDQGRGEAPVPELQGHSEAGRGRVQEEELTISPYPSLFQINTRVWLTELSSGLGRTATLDDIPDAELDRLARLGFDWIWLLSVWQTGPAAQHVSRSHPEWRREFEETLPDLREEDIGDPGLRSPATRCIRCWAATPPWRVFATACDNAV